MWQFLAVSLGACSTYHYSNDPYIGGIRAFDKKDYEMAKRQWEPLAKSGDCDAQYRLGTLYFLGWGVAQDYETAQQLWLSAADRGQASAQMLLATMYAHNNMSVKTMGSTTWFDCQTGCGYEKDMLLAYQWMKLSERLTPYESGRRFARARSEQYRQSLTEEQRLTADRYVRDWKALPFQCEQREIVNA